MKKVFLFLVAIIIFFAACKKENTNLRESSSEIDTEEITEIPAEDVADVIDYDTEGTMKIDSITGDKAADERNTWQTLPYKYTGFLKVGRQDNAATLTVHLSKKDSDFVSVTSNIDTALTLSNLTRVDDTKYTFLCATKNHDFSTKNVKFTFTANRSVNGTPKTFVKSAKLVGVNQLSNMYRTQMWGLNSLGVTSLGNPQSATAIDSSYIPLMGDKLCFDYDEMRGIITDMPVEVATSAANIAAKGKRYKFEVTQYNARSKNERTVKKYSLYAVEFKPSSLKFLSASKAEAATKYFR